jgi:hypothetical protein
MNMRRLRLAIGIGRVERSSGSRPDLQQLGSPIEANDFGHIRRLIHGCEHALALGLLSAVLLGDATG